MYLEALDIQDLLKYGIPVFNMIVCYYFPGPAPQDPYHQGYSECAWAVQHFLSSCDQLDPEIRIRTINHLAGRMHQNMESAPGPHSQLLPPRLQLVSSSPSANGGDKRICPKPLPVQPTTAPHSLCSSPNPHQPQQLLDNRRTSTASRIRTTPEATSKPTAGQPCPSTPPRGESRMPHVHQSHKMAPSMVTPSPLGTRIPDNQRAQIIPRPVPMMPFNSQTSDPNVLRNWLSVWPTLHPFPVAVTSQVQKQSSSDQ